MEQFERKVHGKAIQKDKEGLIIQTNKDITLPEGVDAEFIDILNDVINEHDKTFRGLVNR